MTELKFNPGETLPLLPSSPRSDGVLAQAESLSQQGKIQEALDVLAPFAATSSAAKGLVCKLEAQVQKQNSFLSLNLITAFFPQNNKAEAPEVLQRLAASLQEQKNLRLAFDGLNAKDRNEIRAKLGVHLDEIFSLSENHRTEQFFEEAIHFGVRLKQNDELDAAGGVLSFVANAKDGVSAELGKNAELELQGMLGMGGTGRRFEFLLGRFSREMSDYRTIAPMIGASVLGHLVNTAALGRFAGMSQGFLTRGVGARWVAGSLGFFAEASAFALSGRAFADSPAGPIGEDFARAFLTIGALRLCSFLGNQAFLKMHGFNELGIPTQLTSLARFNQVLFPQAAMFTGMMVSHKIEEALKLRPHVDGATTVTDTLASMLSMEVGSHLGHSVLGEGFARLQKEMGIRTDIFTTTGAKQEIIKSTPTASSVLQEGFRSFALRSPLTWMLMGVEGGGGGKFGKDKGKKDLSKTLELAASENPLAMERLVQEAKKNNQEALDYLEWLAEDSSPEAMVALADVAKQNPEAAFGLIAFADAKHELALALIPTLPIETLLEMSQSHSDEPQRENAMAALIHLTRHGNEKAKEAVSQLDLQVLAKKAERDQAIVFEGKGGHLGLMTQEVMKGANPQLKVKHFLFATSSLGVLLRQRNPEAFRALIELSEAKNELAFNTLMETVSDPALYSWMMPALLASAQRHLGIATSMIFWAEANPAQKVRMESLLKRLELDKLPQGEKGDLGLFTLVLLGLARMGHDQARKAGKILEVDSLSQKASTDWATIELLFKLSEELKNLGAKNVLRNLDLSHYIRSAKTEVEGVLILADLANLFHPQAEERLRTLDVSELAKQAEALAKYGGKPMQTEKFANAFYELSKSGNAKARQALIKLANLDPKVFGDALKDFAALESLEIDGAEANAESSRRFIFPGTIETLSVSEFDERFNSLPSYHGEPLTWVKENDGKILDILSYGKIDSEGKRRTLYLHSVRFDSPDGAVNYLMMISDSPHPLDKQALQNGRNVWLETGDGEIVKAIQGSMLSALKDGRSTGEAIRWLKEESPWTESKVLKKGGILRFPASGAPLIPLADQFPIRPANLEMQNFDPGKRIILADAPEIGIEHYGKFTSKQPLQREATNDNGPDLERSTDVGLPLEYPLLQEKTKLAQEIETLRQQFSKTLYEMAKWGVGAPAKLSTEALGLSKEEVDTLGRETFGQRKFRLLGELNAKHESLKQVNAEIRRALEEKSGLEADESTREYFEARDSEGFLYFLRPIVEGETLASNHGGPWVVEQVEGINLNLRHEGSGETRVFNVRGKEFKPGERLALTPPVGGGSGEGGKGKGSGAKPPSSKIKLYLSKDEFEKRERGLQDYQGKPVTIALASDSHSTEGIQQYATLGRISKGGVSKRINLVTMRVETSEEGSFYFLVADEYPTFRTLLTSSTADFTKLQTKDARLAWEIHQAFLEVFRITGSVRKAMDWLKKESPWAGSEVPKKFSGVAAEKVDGGEDDKSLKTPISPEEVLKTSPEAKERIEAIRELAKRRDPALRPLFEEALQKEIGDAEWAELMIALRHLPPQGGPGGGLHSFALGPLALLGMEWGITDVGITAVALGAAAAGGFALYRWFQSRKISQPKAPTPKQLHLQLESAWGNALGSPSSLAEGLKEEISGQVLSGNLPLEGFEKICASLSSGKLKVEDLTFVLNRSRGSVTSIYETALQVPASQWLSEVGKSPDWVKTFKQKVEMTNIIRTFMGYALGGRDPGRIEGYYGAAMERVLRKIVQLTKLEQGVPNQDYPDKMAGALSRLRWSDFNENFFGPGDQIAAIFASIEDPQARREALLNYVSKKNPGESRQPSTRVISPEILKLHEKLNRDDPQAKAEALLELQELFPQLSPEERLPLTLHAWEQMIATGGDIWDTVLALSALPNLIVHLGVEDQVSLLLKLEERLEDPDHEVRAEITSGLKSLIPSLEPKDRLPRVLKIEALYEDSHWMVRANAIKAMGQLLPDLDPKDATLRILKIREKLTDENEQVRASAAEALENFGSRITEPPQENGGGATGSSLGLMSFAALKDFGISPFEGLQNAWQDFWQGPLAVKAFVLGSLGTTAAFWMYYHFIHRPKVRALLKEGFDQLLPNKIDATRLPEEIRLSEAQLQELAKQHQVLQFEIGSKKFTDVILTQESDFGPFLYLPEGTTLRFNQDGVFILLIKNSGETIEGSSPKDEEKIQTQPGESPSQPPQTFSSWPPDPAWKAFTGSGQIIPPEKRQITRYHDNGSLRLVKLASAHIVEKILFPRGTTLKFDETGRLLWVILGGNCNIHGVRYELDSFLQFEDGRVVPTNWSGGGMTGALLAFLGAGTTAQILLDPKEAHAATLVPSQDASRGTGPAALALGLSLLAMAAIKGKGGGKKGKVISFGEAKLRKTIEANQQILLGKGFWEKFKKAWAGLPRPTPEVYVEVDALGKILHVFTYEEIGAKKPTVQGKPKTYFAAIQIDDEAFRVKRLSGMKRWWDSEKEEFVIFPVPPAEAQSVLRTLQGRVFLPPGYDEDQAKRELVKALTTLGIYRKKNTPAQNGSKLHLHLVEDEDGDPQE